MFRRIRIIIRGVRLVRCRGGCKFLILLIDGVDDDFVSLVLYPSHPYTHM